MNRAPCPHADDVAAASAAGPLPEPLRAHVESCRECSESLIVATFLRDGSAAARAEMPPLPDAGYLWWRAQLEEREAASRRATLVIAVVQRASLVSAGIVAVPLAGWAWSHIRPLLSALNPAALAPALPAGSTNPALVIAISLAVLAALALADLSERGLER